MPYHCSLNLGLTKLVEFLYFHRGSNFRCGSMLFDPKPKTRKVDLFNFEKEFNRLSYLINDPLTRLIVVKGLRRTGKTSLSTNIA